MIIDVHTHVLAFPKIKLNSGATALMSAEQQICLMDSKGIDMAVILPLVGPESPGECQSIGEVLYICDNYPGRFIPFCNLDPRRADLLSVADFEFILNQYKALGCKGLGELTARLYWDDPRMLLLLEACEKLSMPVTFHTTVSERIDTYGVIDEIGLPRLEKVLQKFPSLKFFGHSAGFWSEISSPVTLTDKNDYPQGTVKAGGAIKRLMRQYQNLYGDISAGSGYNALARDPKHAYEFIDEFQDRLMLGLDYCSIKNDMKHIEWFKDAVDNQHISKDVYEKIMYKNAVKLLGIEIKR